jgi:hypothetical protein
VLAEAPWGPSSSSPYVLPAHYKSFGIGLSITAYTRGLRHAFDADHISAIDNTTRKSMNDRHGTDQPRPLAYGYLFSLGHPTIVFAIGVAIHHRGQLGARRRAPRNAARRRRRPFGCSRRARRRRTSPSGPGPRYQIVQDE